MSWKQLLCSAVDNNRTVNTVEDRQPICMPRLVYSGRHSRAYVVIRVYRCVKVTNCLRGKLFTV